MKNLTKDVTLNWKGSGVRGYSTGVKNKHTDHFQVTLYLSRWFQSLPVFCLKTLQNSLTASWAVGKGVCCHWPRSPIRPQRVNSTYKSLAFCRTICIKHTPQLAGGKQHAQVLGLMLYNFCHTNNIAYMGQTTHTSHRLFVTWSVSHIQNRFEGTNHTHRTNNMYKSVAFCHLICITRTTQITSDKWHAKVLGLLSHYLYHIYTIVYMGQMTNFYQSKHFCHIICVPHTIYSLYGIKKKNWITCMGVGGVVRQISSWNPSFLRSNTFFKLGPRVLLRTSEIACMMKCHCQTHKQKCTGLSEQMPSQDLKKFKTSHKLALQNKTCFLKTYRWSLERFPLSIALISNAPVNTNAHTHIHASHVPTNRERTRISVPVSYRSCTFPMVHKSHPLSSKWHRMSYYWFHHGTPPCKQNVTQQKCIWDSQLHLHVINHHLVNNPSLLKFEMMRSLKHNP